MADTGMNEEELTKEEKKAQKKEEKEKKKEEKKKKKDAAAEGEEVEEEEKTSSKLLVFFITILIIAIWLGIIAILIKADVGGFGSTILKPLLKDVPYVSNILPEDSENATEVDTQYQYTSMKEAIDRIKELEKEVDGAKDNAKKKDKKIDELTEQVNDLQKYKTQQDEFEKLKQKFYKEVVYADNAPDIEEYKTYYESIDSENAAVLYKQVVEQLQADEKVQEYAKTYSSMKPKEAAAIFDTMTNDYDLVADILLNMDAQSRADILGKMNAKNAAALTEIMEPKQNN